MPCIDVASGYVYVLQGEFADDLVDGEMVGAQLVTVDEDIDLPFQPPPRT